MNCCIDCFSSPYLKDLIIRNGLLGDCEICFSKSISIYESKNLYSIFQIILDVYFVDNEFGENFECQIEKDFPKLIFSFKVNSENRKLLLQSILENELESYINLLNKKVYPSFANNILQEKLVNPLQISWEKFAKEIKTTNRFHIQNTLDLDYLKNLLSRYSKSIKENQIFYRSRISDINGFENKQMANPPPEKAKSGRANPT